MRLLTVALVLFNLIGIITDPGTVISSAPTQEPKAEQAAERRAEVVRLNEQVEGLINEARFDEALPLANSAWEISKTALGPTDTVVANAATNLAALHVAKGKTRLAEPLLLRAIEVNDASRRPSDPIVIKTLEMYTCVLNRSEQDDKLKEFDNSRLVTLASSTEPDRFWGAVWRATKLVYLPKPEYPMGARGLASGRIVVEVTVDERGKVTSAQSMCGGNVLLKKVSEEAARQAQFKPVEVNGKPVRIIGYLFFRFVDR